MLIGGLILLMTLFVVLEMSWGYKGGALRAVRGPLAPLMKSAAKIKMEDNKVKVKYVLICPC